MINLKQGFTDSPVRIEDDYLRLKYGLDFLISPYSLPMLTTIIGKFEAGERLSHGEAAWLNFDTDEHSYLSEELRTAFHSIEADFYIAEFKEYTNPQSAITAASHYLLCGKAKQAEQLLSTISVEGLCSDKLKVEFSIILGRAKRDLKHWNGALVLGLQAHNLINSDVNPCVLLGGINMEIGNYDEGQLWYEKALRLGAHKNEIYEDVRKILAKSKSSKRKKITEELLTHYPHCYTRGKLLEEKKPKDNLLQTKKNGGVSVTKIADYYFLDDIPSAKIPGTRIQTILLKFHQENKISDASLNYLINLKLNALVKYARKLLSFDEFIGEASKEQAKRKIHKDEESRKAIETAEEREKERESVRKKQQEKQEQERQRLSKDPKHIAKLKNQNLRDKYGVCGFIEPEFLKRMMKIIRDIDSGKRLGAADVFWLETEADSYGYYSYELRSAFHDTEASFHALQFKKSNDVWAAINASSHYRKCQKSKEAEVLLNKIDIKKIKSARTKSAIYTTLGGVKRDLNKRTEAITLGEDAHKLISKDFRPCTLLGALHMELHDYSTGQSWYEKAIQLGASDASIYNDIRKILSRLDKVKRDEAIVYLLENYPNRYTKKKLLQNL